MENRRESDTGKPAHDTGIVPGEDRKSPIRGVIGYGVGFILAAALTGMSFWVGASDLFWQPGVAIGLCVLAVAQMGIHLTFFLHISTGPDNTNNVMALAFGILIVVLVGAGSLWIMFNLNANMMPMDRLMDMHQQR